MEKSLLVKRALGVLGVAAAALLTVSPSAMAADPPKPAASCKIPSLTAVPDSVSPGTSVTVTGQNFSGCPAEGNPAAPTPVVQVKVGIGTDQNMSQVLATTQTAADGSFSVSLTIPSVASAGNKIVLAAGSKDDVTQLVYAAVVPLGYTGGGAAPTGVPAGTGGTAATADSSDDSALTVAGGVGVLLLGAGAIGARRRALQHQ